MTAEEEKAFARQLELAVEFELPAMVHTPHRDKEQGTRRTLELVDRVGPRARHGRRRPPQRGHRRPGRRGRLLDGVLDLPRHQDGPAPDGRDPAARAALERVLVNSAADWGRSDPLQTSRDRRRRCSRPASPTTTSTGCCGATRSSSSARAAGSCVDRTSPTTAPPAPTPRDLRGQLDPARLAGLTMRLQPPRRHRRPPRLRHQRPAGRGRRRPDRPGRHVRRPARASDLGTDRVGARAVAAAPAAARRLAADLDARRAAAGRARPSTASRSSPSTPSPTPPSRTTVVKQRVYHPTGRSASVSTTPSTARGAGRAAARRRRPRQHLDPAARLAQRRGRRRDQAHAELHLGRLAEGLAEVEAETGRTRPGRLRARAGLRHRDRSPRRSSGSPRSTASGSASCLDLCHLAVGFEDATEALARLDAAGLARRQGPAGRGARRRRPGRPGRAAPR